MDLSYHPLKARKRLSGLGIGWYAGRMSTKLSSVNRYLRDPDVREKTVTRSVTTSSAIEGIRTSFGRRAQMAGSPKSHLIQRKS